MNIDKSTLTSWAMLATEPVKLLDAIAAHPNCQPELAKLLDSVAHQFELLQQDIDNHDSDMEMLKADLDEMENDKNYWEDEFGRIEDEKFDLEAQIEKLEAELDSLR